VIFDRRNDTARIYRSFFLGHGNVGYLMTTDQIGECHAENDIPGYRDIFHVDEPQAFCCYGGV
jgi:hypothetical protein